jgi:hypothetical protein
VLAAVALLVQGRLKSSILLLTNGRFQGRRRPRDGFDPANVGSHSHSRSVLLPKFPPFSNRNHKGLT